MNSTLIFLASINLAGFTALPYFLSKLDCLNVNMPLGSSHKIFTLIELIFLTIVFHPYNGEQVVAFFYLFSVFCYLNFFFDFRYMADCLIRNQSVHVYWPNPVKDMYLLRTCELEMNNKADFLYFSYNQNRIMLDLTLFCLIVCLVL